jgi:hypothetical protein
MVRELIDTIKAIIRIRYLMQMEEEAVYLVRAAKAIDDNMNEDEVPPDGDTYNALWMYVSAFGEVMKID